MIIQRIAFPKGAVFEEELYVRCNREHVAVIGEDNILIASNTFSQIHFDTYFNTFSRKKWNKYTNLENLSLQIDIQGDARVILTKLELHGDDIEEYIVASEIIRNTE